MYEYFRIGTRQVWHIAPPFSRLPLPERNQVKSLCGYPTGKRMESARHPYGEVCEKCLARVTEGWTDAP